MRYIIFVTSLILILGIGVPLSVKAEDVIEIEAEGSYLMGVDSSVDLAKEVALFKAKKSMISSRSLRSGGPHGR